MPRPRTTHAEHAVQEFTLPDGMPYTLTMLQTSKMLGCSTNGCYEAARRGEIPTIRIGRRLVVPTLALMAMLDGSGVAGSAQAGESCE